MNGTLSEPITIKGSDNIGSLTVINAKKKSKLNFVFFSKLTQPNLNSGGVSGSVTFYESPVSLNNCTFSKNLSEDNLNIVRSIFSISNVKFIDSYSDHWILTFLMEV